MLENLPFKLTKKDWALFLALMDADLNDGQKAQIMEIIFLPRMKKIFSSDELQSFEKETDLMTLSEYVDEMESGLRQKYMS